MSLNGRAAGGISAKELLRLLSPPFCREQWLACSTEHLHVRIANNLPAIDRKASLQQLSAFLELLDDVGSGFCEFWQLGEVVIAETEFGVRDSHGGRYIIPCVVIARVPEAHIKDLRLYLDPALLVSRSKNGND